RRGEAEAAEIVSGGMAFRFLAGPTTGTHQHIDAADQIHRATRIRDLPGEVAGTKADAFESATGMVRQHLPDGMAEMIAVGDTEEEIFNVFVYADGSEHSIISRGLRTMEPEFLRRALGNVDRDRVGSRVCR